MPIKELIRVAPASFLFGFELGLTVKYRPDSLYLLSIDSNPADVLSVYKVLNSASLIA